jgi:hypothetical protein
MSESIALDADSFSVTEKKPRYPLPLATQKYRKTLKPGPRTILNEMIDMFRADGKEREVAVTVRQLAAACQMSEGSVKNAIKALVASGFIVVVTRGMIEIKRKPSTYRLTMFPCRGEDASHDYVDDVKDWRRAVRKKRPDAPLPAKVRVAFDVEPARLIELGDAITPFVASSP